MVRYGIMVNTLARHVFCVVAAHAFTSPTANSASTNTTKQ